MAKLIAEKPIMASATPTMPRGMPMVQTAHPTNTRAYFVISIAISSLVLSLGCERENQHSAPGRSRSRRRSRTSA
jgi:hypothetical protein